MLTISTTDGSHPKTGSSLPSRIRRRIRRIRIRIRRGNGRRIHGIHGRRIRGIHGRRIRVRIRIW